MRYGRADLRTCLGYYVRLGQIVSLHTVLY